MALYKIKSKKLLPIIDAHALYLCVLRKQTTFFLDLGLQLTEEVKLQGV